MTTPERQNRTTFILAIAASLTVFGCDKKEDTAGDPAAKTTDPGATKEKPVEPAKPAKPEVVTRVFDCKFVAWEGEGEERQAKFALTNRGKALSTSIQTWIYYYDTSGKQIDRYPHALSGKFEVGKAQEQLLGQKGKRIKEEVKDARCEVSRVDFGKESRWENENLVYNSFSPRPLDGQTHEQLAAREGIKVSAVWDGKLGDKAMFKLTNTTKRPVKVRTVWIYYYDATGKQLGRAVANLLHDLAPGESVEQALGHDAEKIPEGTAHVEAGVSKIDYQDGEKETWWNRNQALGKRKMVGKPSAAAPAE